MKIGGNNIVWLSENENVQITSSTKYGKIYIVSRTHVYGYTSVRLSIATFKTQGEAINYTSNITDVPIKEVY